MATKPQFEHPQAFAEYQAGHIDENGVGISTEYPKMLYRKGAASGDRTHLLAEEPIKIAGKDLRTLLVESADEEAEAIADGWFYTPALTKTKEQEQAEEIARLRAQVDEQPKRGPGRPRAETQEAE